MRTQNVYADDPSLWGTIISLWISAFVYVSLCVRLHNCLHDSPDERVMFATCSTLRKQGELWADVDE